jgi:hypothetical protein
MFGSPLDSHLDPGETLLWSGQPKQGVRLQAADVFLIPFSLVWGGFAFFWEAGVLGLIHVGGRSVEHPAPLFFALWGIPFCLVGIYMIFGRFFFDAASRTRTWYGLTNERVIIVKTLFRTTTISLDLANLAALNLIERKDNSGDVVFGAPGPFGGYQGGGVPQSSRYPATPGFYLLPQARQVYNRIREAQRKLRT